MTSNGPGDLLYFDDDDLDDDWEYATRSDDMAAVLIEMLADKARNLAAPGQSKVIWARVIAEMHAAYYNRFLGPVEQLTRSNQ